MIQLYAVYKRLKERHKMVESERKETFQCNSNQKTAEVAILDKIDFKF